MRLKDINPNYLFISAAVVAALCLIIVNRLNMIDLLFLVFVLVVVIFINRLEQWGIKKKTSGLIGRLKERDKTIDKLKEDIDEKNRSLEEKNNLILGFKERIEDAVGNLKT